MVHIKEFFSLMKYETGGVELDLFFLMVRLFLKYLDFSNFSTEILKKRAWHMNEVHFQDAQELLS